MVCGMAKIPLTVLSRAVLPYVAWQMAVLLLCTYILLACGFRGSSGTP